MLRAVLLVIVNFAVCSVSAGDVVINEVMASNATTLADEDGDHEDWIEIHNAGPAAVPLGGYGLSDDFGDPFKWVFPEVTIQAGEFLIIWASGKDRDDPAYPLHSGFRISQDGEEVLLTHPDGTLLDALEPRFIPTDISYGRKPDGGDQWYYFSRPTPGAPNATEGFAGITEPPVFSVMGGFYSEGFSLAVHHDDPDATIVFTTDGSVPDMDNLDGTSYPYKNHYPFHPGDPFGDTLFHNFRSFVYEGGLQVDDRTPEPDILARISATVQPPDYMPEENVYKGTVVRARAYQEGMIPSDVVTHSYFVNGNGFARGGLPVVSLSISENHLFDYFDGIYTPGVDADQWRIDNPDQSFSWPFRGNFRRRGDLWEYPAHVEFFECDGSRVVAQDIGVRIHGGATRSFPMKSLRLYARNMYSNSLFTCDVFGSGEQGYKRLILRNSGNDFPTSIWRPDFSSRTMFRDAAIQAIVAHMDPDTQEYRPAVLFINGEYWGIQNIRERYDKHYLLRNYGAGEGMIDLLTGKDEPKEGDNLHYRGTIEYIETHGLADEGHYNYIQTRIDTKNFIDYQIANIYADNTDWPGNNIDFWRYRTEGYRPDAPPGLDGRWRWLLFDTDFGFGLVGDDHPYKHNTLAFATKEDGDGWPNPPWSTFLLRSFLENEQFRVSFINRFADLLNTAFLPGRVNHIISTMKEEIRPAIEDHFSRWGYPDALGEWEGHVEVMTRFGDKRPQYQREHIKDHFGLESLIRVNLDVNNQLMGHIRINSVEVEPATPGVNELPYPWQGLYFKGIPIELEAMPKPGYLFSHWEGSVHSDACVVAIDGNSDVEITAHFERSEKPVLLHYWFFDTTMPNDTPLKSLDPHYYAVNGGVLEYASCLEGYPYHEGHPLWRKASMERRNQPSPLNYRPGGNNAIPYHETDMRGLQVRQPLNNDGRENEIIFHLPTQGFDELVFSFAALDEGAAYALVFDYSVAGGEPQWKPLDPDQNVMPLYDQYALYEVDFGGIEGAGNNPHFRIRIRFLSDDPEGDDGDRVTFNNFALEGVPVGAYTVRISSEGNGKTYPAGDLPVYGGMDLGIVLLPDTNHAVNAFTVDGVCKMDDLSDPGTDGRMHYTLPGIHADRTVYAAFGLLPEIIGAHDDAVVVYPNPASSHVAVAALEEIKAVELIRLDGRIVQRDAGLDAREHLIDIAHLRNGMYVLRIHLQEQIVVRKFKVMR